MIICLKGQQLLNTTWLDMAGQSFSVQRKEPELYCNAAWDGLGCWPITNPGTILIRSCKDVFNSVGELPKDHIDDSSFNNGKFVKYYFILRVTTG